MRHGYGTFTYTCGTYQGNYENDKRNGQGTWTGMHCKGKKVSPFVLFNYTGGWKDDRIFGKGIHETPYQKVEGTFKENKHLYGPGRITYQKSRQRPKSGGTIIGEFEKGLDNRDILNKSGKNESLFLNHLQKVIDNRTTNADHMINKFSKNEDLNDLYDK